ncbi:MAG TPA: acyltransferase [Candidatus Limnocylindria bacterium]|nr:acyltransferase [Candidatus Limnocylindria bacterium]
MDDKTDVAALPGARERDLAIDMAKGCAILWVLLIHSDALHGNLFFRQVVNQAVPVFVVLFGLNSSIWWRHRVLPADLGAWYRRAVGRIMLPVWAALPLWWAMVLYYRPFGVRLAWWLPIAHALGYLLHVGTGWFVTMIVQLVVLFPAFEAARRRVSVWPLLVVGFASSAVLAWNALWIVGYVGLFGFWVLGPRFFAHVTFGMLLAHHRERVGAWAAVLAAAALGGCVAADLAQVGPPWKQLLETAGGLPLTVLLLVGLRPLASVPLLAPSLAWLGRSSYGIYIGQLLTHNLFVYHFGLLGLPQRVDPWLYTLILLLGGLFFVWLGEQLLRVSASLRARTVVVRKALDTPRRHGGS